MKAVTHGKIVLKDEICEGQILIYGNSIEELIPASTVTDLSGMEVIDAQGRYVSPGLIDMHIHGLAGVDVMDGSTDAIGVIARTVPKHGVTAFVPTTMTMAPEVIDRAVKAVRQYMNVEECGAEVLGVHLEGPFISHKFKGAQNAEYIQNPNFKRVENWLDVVKVLTFAPELEGAELFIEEIQKQSDVVLSIGHSDASYEEALKFYEKGVRHITHCFNAMSPLHHRAPGVVGAALAWPFTTEIICDNNHVNPNFYQGFVNIKGVSKTVLITDCMQAGCLPDGEYALGGQNVCVQHGAPRLENGALAGSTLKMHEALRNLKKQTQLKLNEILQMATLNPARVLGVDHRLGSLEVGKDADFFIHNEDFDICCTVGKGNILYKAGC